MDDPEHSDRIEQLKSLIEFAWSDGIMTDQENEYILGKARELGVPPDTVSALSDEVRGRMHPISERVLSEIRGLLELALTDGHLSASEEEFVRTRAQTNNLTESQTTTLIDEARKRLQGKSLSAATVGRPTAGDDGPPRSDIVQELSKSVVGIECGDSNGTGIIAHKRGIIITNRHVVPSDDASITFHDGEQRGAYVMKSIDEIDISFLAAGIPKDQELSVARLGSTSDIREGDRVFAIGHPMGLPYTVTDGIISAKNRVRGSIGYLQTNADINPGNSGGPLCNEHGEIVGINTFSLEGTHGLNFALPVHYVEQEIERVARDWEVYASSFIDRRVDEIIKSLHGESPNPSAVMVRIIGLLHFEGIPTDDRRITTCMDRFCYALLKEHRLNSVEYEAFKRYVPNYNATELETFLGLSFRRVDRSLAQSRLGIGIDVSRVSSEEQLVEQMAAVTKRAGLVVLCNIAVRTVARNDSRLSSAAREFLGRM